MSKNFTDPDESSEKTQKIKRIARREKTRKKLKKQILKYPEDHWINSEKDKKFPN